jgi:hypothetical protein
MWGDSVAVPALDGRQQCRLEHWHGRVQRGHLRSGLLCTHAAVHPRACMLGHDRLGGAQPDMPTYVTRVWVGASDAHPSCMVAEIQCPAITASFAAFVATAAGTASVTGACVSGYGGTVTASCSLAGSWTFSGACTRMARPHWAHVCVPRCVHAHVCGCPVQLHRPRARLCGRRRCDGDVASGGRWCDGEWRVRVGLWRQPAADVQQQWRVARAKRRRMRPRQMQPAGRWYCQLALDHIGHSECRWHVQGGLHRHRRQPASAQLPGQPGVGGRDQSVHPYGPLRI